MSLTKGGYHYLGTAKILAPIGEAFAKPRRGDGKVAANPNTEEALKRFIDGGGTIPASRVMVPSPCSQARAPWPKLGHKWKLVTFSNDEAGFAKATEMLRAELDAGRAVGIDFTTPGGAGHTLTVAGYNLAAEVYVLRDPAHPSPGLRLMTSKDLAHFCNSRYYSRVATKRCRPAIVLVTE